MSALRYPVLIDLPTERTNWLVEVPDLPGCQAQGDSLAEAMAAARGAVMRWLQAAQAQGLALPPASSADDLQARQAHGGRLVRTVEVMWPEPGDTP